MLMILYQFRNDGIRDKKAGLWDAEAGARRDEVAGREGVREGVGGAVGAEEVRIDAVAGAQAEHNAFEDDLLVGQVFEAAY